MSQTNAPILTGAFGRVESDLSTLSNVTEGDSQAGGTRQSKKRTKSSSSWIFANGWVQVEDSEDDNCQYFVCQYPIDNEQICQRKYKRVGGTTSNILYHVRSVHGVSESTTYGSVKEKNAQARGIQVYFRAAGEPHFTKEEYRTAIIDFVISASLPFTIVENDSFQRLITLAQLAPSPASAKLPSPRTIRRDINAQHATLFEQISAMLSSQPFLAYTLDCWTSEWSDPFLAVTAHFINSDWVQQSVVIGMEPLTGTHSGQNLAFAFVSILRSMGLATKQF